MDTQKDKDDTTAQHEFEDGETIEKSFQQMEILYKSRCVQAPLGANITIREVAESKKEE